MGSIMHAKDLKEMAAQANQKYSEQLYNKLCDELIPKFVCAAKAGIYEYKVVINSADPITIKAWERFNNTLSLAGYDVRFIWYDGRRELSEAIVSWI